MQNLLDKDLQFCSQGDTSSKHIPKKIFRGAKGSFLYDTQNVKYLDMQMLIVLQILGIKTLSMTIAFTTITYYPSFGSRIYERE